MNSCTMQTAKDKKCPEALMMFLWRVFNSPISDLNLHLRNFNLQIEIQIVAQMRTVIPCLNTSKLRD